MIRQQRRFRIRTLEKELKWIQKHSILSELLKDEALVGLTKEDALLLKDNKHENKDLQEKFNKLRNLLQEVYGREKELIQLRNHKENIPNVKK